jgi:uncharacterized OB-fold protein
MIEVGETASRPAYWAPFVKAAQNGGLKLQVCNDCHVVKYPPSEICAQCLGDSLEWSDVDGAGRVLARTELLTTTGDVFSSLLPLPIGTVRLNCGPVVLAFFADPNTHASNKINVVSAISTLGEPVLLAHNQGHAVDSGAFNWNGSSLQQLFVSEGKS